MRGYGAFDEMKEVEFWWPWSQSDDITDLIALFCLFCVYLSLSITKHLEKKLIC